ncbi:hypothetical protein DIPPA_05928 [Diplonema papillatum]|nr:hypothetical protein DIPPA_05928 [Diplonema papillatum]
MEDYDPDAELQWLTEMLEKKTTTQADVAVRLEKLKVYVDSFAEDLKDSKHLQKNYDKATAELERLEPLVTQMREDATRLQSSSEANKELTELTGQIRSAITKQCERLRLQRSDDLPPPFNNLKSIQEITRDRENEITVATKQLRELKMILKMMKQHEDDLRAESDKLIDEKTEEKDAGILHMTMRCLREREQLLEDTKAIKMDIDAIEQHLRAGHYENKQRKEQRLLDHRTKIQHDYIDTNTAAFDEPTATGEDVAVPMRFEDKFEAVLRKENPNDPTGLQFEDKTRLTGVVPGSPGEKCNFGKFIGRRVTHVNGQEMKPGNPLRLSGLSEVTVRFDMDVEHLRCSTIKTEEDDPFKQFAKKEALYKDPYKDLEASTAQIKKEVQAEKQNVEKHQKRLREYQQKIAAEKVEKERELRRLVGLLANTKNKQAEYEAESQRLFGWMEDSQKKLEGLKGKARAVRKNTRSLTANPDRRQIAGPKAIPRDIDEDHTNGNDHEEAVEEEDEY